MSRVRPVEIVGGGLAGLSLGLALCKMGLPVSIFEAGDYPRHRVCGEFIAGLDARTRATLALEGPLEGALLHRTVSWHENDRAAGHSVLPEAAFGLSRHALDVRLAEAFVTAGGKLFTHARIATETAGPGRVIAAGRRRQRSRWIGLKAHVEGFSTSADLELYLGRDAYVGICSVGEDRVNFCGLFRSHPGLQIDPRATPLEKHLRAAGLNRLAERLAKSSIDASSVCAVAALSFARPDPQDPRLLIGDAFAMIPPFTGNGMAMAFQSAAAALGPIAAWSRGEREWVETVRIVRRRLRRRFGVRLVVADLLHRFVHAPPPQRWFLAANRAGLVPFRPFYRILH